jgi:tripartite-type tricarboxylate transporter receptor subunit TctC
MPFKQEELKPVIMMGSSGTALAVNPSLGVNSLKELIAKGKTQSLNFSSAGSASPGHIGAAMLSEATGIKTTHVPYRGNAPAVLALVSGEVDAGILATTGLLPHIKADKIKVLAIAGPNRSVLLPDVPTTAELGIPDVRVDFLALAMVPSKTPDNIVNILQKSIAKAISQPDIQERLRGLDIVPASIPGPEVAERLSKERERYMKIIKATGLKAD